MGMLTELEFQKKADATFDELKRRLLTASDEHDFSKSRSPRNL
jgi:frataxin-like iron-binding protein CyaY